MKSFYENAKILDELKHKVEPSRPDCENLLSIIGQDESLSWYFYEKNDFGDEPQTSWLELLCESGEFDDLGEIDKGSQVKPSQYLKAKYIERCAGEKPDEVLRIIKTLRPKEQQIQSIFINALRSMGPEKADEGVEIVKEYFAQNKQLIWYFVGESAAKLMVVYAEGGKKDEALEIARLLLKVWVPKEEEGKGYFEDIRGRFSEHESNELMFEHVQKMWDKYPYETGLLLVELFDDYLKELDEGKDYESSEVLYATIENLADVSSRTERDHKALIIEGICKASQKIIEDEANRAEEFLERLRACNRVIFNRIEMYLLRFLSDNKFNPRINKIIENPQYFEDYNYRYEYSLLLKDRKDVVEERVKKQYLKWVDEIKIGDQEDFEERFKKWRKRDCTEADIEEHESSMKARKLFLVREIFPIEYEKYKNKCGYSDADLMPRPAISSGGVRAVSGSEGTPKSKEELLGMGVDEVLDFCSDPANYPEPEDGGYRPNSAAEALAYTFQSVVKERAVDYLHGDINRVTKLSSRFISKYFLGIWEALREKQLEGFLWDTFVAVSNAVVEEHGTDTDYSYAFQTMVHCFQAGFEDNNNNNINYSGEFIDGVYSALRPLFDLKEEIDISFERDPMQIRCNSCTGTALELCLSLGIFCKKNDSEKFMEDFRDKVRDVFNRVLFDLKKSWTICTFGSYFSRIYWLDKEWVEGNIGEILSDKNWPVVWDTFLKWGRPSPELFGFLSSKGYYDKAIGLIDSAEKKDKEESYGEMLSKQIVIAYFNGWLGEDKGQILEKFLHGADDKLRGKAARFFTTGFKSLKEEPDPETTARIEKYWTIRLEEIEKEPGKHLEEAKSLARWIVESPLDAKKTFELVIRTLEVSGGKLHRSGDVYTFINSACNLSEGNELEAVWCIRKVLVNDYIAIHFSFYKDKLTGLLEKISGMENCNVELVKESLGLVDDLGRLHVYEYRGLYEELSNKL